MQVPKKPSRIFRRSLNGGSEPGGTIRRRITLPFALIRTTPATETLNACSRKKNGSTDVLPLAQSTETSSQHSSFLKEILMINTVSLSRFLEHLPSLISPKKGGNLAISPTFFSKHNLHFLCPVPSIPIKWRIIYPS